MHNAKILIVEDIMSLSLAYKVLLEAADFTVETVPTLEDATKAIASSQHGFSAILLDLNLPDGDGLDWLQRNEHIIKECAVIVATADSSLNRAIDAMRLGAYDFMVKPISHKRLVASFTSAIETRFEPPVTGPAKTADTKKSAGFQGFLGESAVMRDIYAQIANVANSKATIFITGESGTGKEVCAEAIHNSGGRAKRPFIAINCGAIPENLLESELFGHLKGAFTGALSDKIGAVQAAQGGTLFLDEICEMELKLQVKLLRFLQTDTIQRVGSTKTEDVDVRIVCATNRNPQKEVTAGRFREDLYYRLAVVPMHLPPLRARGEDIIHLANAFLTRFAQEEGKHFEPVSRALAQTLSAHLWPGNVRELQNLMRRAAVMYPGPNLDMSLVAELSMAQPVLQQGRAVEKTDDYSMPAQNNADTYEADAHNILPKAAPLALPGQNLSQFDGMTMDQIENLIVEYFIEQHGGSVPSAARKLGLSPSTIYRKRERWQNDGLLSA